MKPDIRRNERNNISKPARNEMSMTIPTFTRVSSVWDTESLSGMGGYAVARTVCMAVSISSEISENVPTLKYRDVPKMAYSKTGKTLV